MRRLSLVSVLWVACQAPNPEPHFEQETPAPAAELTAPAEQKAPVAAPQPAAPQDQTAVR